MSENQHWCFSGSKGQEESEDKLEQLLDFLEHTALKRTALIMYKDDVQIIYIGL
jgi:hypothetical protein